MNLIRYIPNLLTLTNLSLGCIAAIYIFQGKPHFASFLVFAAIIIDFCDGFFARMLKVSSMLGKQLDSLADMLTFGFVPGLIFFYLLKETFNSVPGDIEYPIYYFFPAFLITLCAAVRLAKFNIDENQQDTFSGMPTPANALFIVSLPLILYYTPYNISAYILNKHVLFTLIALLSFLQVAPLRMLNLKFKHFRWKENETRYIFLIISLILIVILTYHAAPLIIAAYIIISLIKHIAIK